MVEDMRTLAAVHHGVDLEVEAHTENVTHKIEDPKEETRHKVGVQGLATEMKVGSLSLQIHHLIAIEGDTLVGTFAQKILKKSSQMKCRVKEQLRHLKTLTYNPSL